MTWNKETLVFINPVEKLSTHSVDYSLLRSNSWNGFSPNVNSGRWISGGELQSVLRPFYFAVHPDLFGQHPEQRVHLIGTWALISGEKSLMPFFVVWSHRKRTKILWSIWVHTLNPCRISEFQAHRQNTSIFTCEILVPEVKLTFKD